MARSGRLVETVKLLDNVSGESTPNQRILARQIGISVGMVNALMHRAVTKGLIKIKEAPARRYAYYLTPKGFAEKSRLVSEYLDVSLTFFRTARREYSELFARCVATGQRRIIMCGAGELTEIAMLAVDGFDLDIIAVFDPQAGEEKVLGLRVLRNLSQIEADCTFIITDGRKPQESYERLATVVEHKRILAPPLLRILPCSEKKDAN